MGEVTQLSRASIEAILPHRGRALMLDRAEVSENEAVGYFTVTEETCEGHFPGQPILRVVDRIEIIALTLALAVAAEVPKGKVAFFGSINGIKFRGQATVGDEVRAEVKVTQRSKLGAKGSGKLFVGDREICSIERLTGVIGELKV